jgi:hypothetical protein
VGDPYSHGSFANKKRRSSKTSVRQESGWENLSFDFEGTGGLSTTEADVAYTPSIGQQGQGQYEQPLYPAQGGDGQAGEFVDDSAGFEWIACPDGKSRPVEPTIRLLAHGVQHRAPILHAFGNAIVPAVAATFIKDHLSGRVCVEDVFA